MNTETSSIDCRSRVLTCAASSLQGQSKGKASRWGWSDLASIVWQRGYDNPGVDYMQNLELIGQAAVRSILCEASDIPPFPDEVDDMRVAHMVALIREGFPFEINTWHGGVKESDAKQWKGGNGPDRLGDYEGEHGQASTTDGHGLGGGHGLTLDVQNIVRCLANELQARAGPLSGIIKTHITQEMVALKEEVLVPLRMPAAGGTADQGKRSVFYINLLIFEDTSV
ncbi:hypothetical protein F2Q69_00019328 [Brassica cretica]|uniref:Uncharacterized protein n=1 Tax=Brassica cretica TaxID=69181 RepID=A0A8S9QIH5_BRACR|nr:hypothetical protein F2Q69_00019328 [Brassica cretica]